MPWVCVNRIWTQIHIHTQSIEWKQNLSIFVHKNDEQIKLFQMKIHFSHNKHKPPTPKFKNKIKFQSSEWLQFEIEKCPKWPATRANEVPCYRHLTITNEMFVHKICGGGAWILLRNTRHSSTTSQLSCCVSNVLTVHTTNKVNGQDTNRGRMGTLYVCVCMWRNEK